MKLLVFGASGRTGRVLVRQALDQGHVVTAFARDPAKVRLTHANKASSLDWVIVRPALLTNGRQRNAYRVGSDPSRISRADVAAFMLEQVTGTKYLRQTPGLAD